MQNTVEPFNQIYLCMREADLYFESWVNITNFLDILLNSIVVRGTFLALKRAQDQSNQDLEHLNMNLNIKARTYFNFVLKHAMILLSPSSTGRLTFCKEA